MRGEFARGRIAGKRAQITVFVIIGLGLLLIVAALLLLRRYVSERPGVPVAGEGGESTLVAQYVDRCIDLSTEQALRLAGAQGGLLYESQGGIAPLGHLDAPIKIPEGGGVGLVDLNIAFGLVNDSGYAIRPWRTWDEFQAQYIAYDQTAQDPYPWPYLGVVAFYDPNDYALPLAPWYDPRQMGEIADGPFGQYALPKLCDPAGPNLVSTETVAQCPPELFNKSFDPRKYSIQASLGSAIAWGVYHGGSSCLNPDELSNLLGVQVNVGTPQASVAFTETETLVSLQLPLTLAADGSELATRSFSRRYDVRLLPISRYAYALLKNASKNPLFIIGEPMHYQLIPHYDGYIVSSELLPEDQGNGRRDLYLVSIIDPKSSLEGQHYAIQFLVQDRPPILDSYWDEAGEPATLVASGGKLELNAKDPDGEDDLLVLAVRTPPGSPNTYKAIGVGSTIENIPAGLANISVTDPSGLSDWQIVNIDVPE